MPVDYWDQPRIAREFGIAANTVQSTWRNASLRALRTHLAGALTAPLHAGHAAQVHAQLGDLREVTRSGWERVRAQYGLPTLRLPRAALPLPDMVVGNKPLWTEKSMNRWADDTRRRAQDGTLRRCSPPGRPAGVVETRPRQRAAAA